MPYYCLALSTAISVTMYVEDDEFNEEDGMGLVCVQISAGQLDGTPATVALTTTDDSASSPGIYKSKLYTHT